jgi:hypothetical protein
MVFAIQFDEGPLVRVKNHAKARVRIKHLLRKDRYKGKAPYFITAQTDEEMRTGFGVRRPWKL